MSSAASRKALVIESYIELQELVCEELRSQLNFQVWTAQDIDEAEKLLQLEVSFDLIICRAKEFQKAYAYFLKCKEMAKSPKIFYMTSVQEPTEEKKDHSDLWIDHEKNFLKIFRDLENYFKK